MMSADEPSQTGGAPWPRHTTGGTRIEERFGKAAGAPSAHWSRTEQGVGHLRVTDDGLRMELDETSAQRYSNAQLDDYSALRASRYPWRPPLRMRVRARASRPAEPAATPPQRRSGGAPWLRGTVGFGFWNAPFTLAGGRLRLPEAVWFFGASSPSDMALTVGGAGHGWKAQVIHSQRLDALAAVGPMALSALWARVAGDDRPATHWMERLTGAREQPLSAAQADLREWHDYALEWRPEIARFSVDGQEVFAAPDPPHGPLGFVAWIDNQYAIATPRGQLRFGALESSPQWLELASLVIEPLA